MSKAAPWIKFFAGDFLNGVADLEADEIGAYTIVLALIWDRGAPIADDPAWLARRAGMSTRRFNQVRAKLIGLGKLEARNGLLGNRRAIAEVEARDRKSDQARGAALARWHGEREPELDLQGGEAEHETPDYLAKNGEKTQEQIDLKSRKSEQKPQKTARTGNAGASSPSRARASQRPESRIIQSNESDSTPREPEPDPPLDSRDLMALLQAAGEAAGYQPVTPGQISREIEFVKAWRDSGIDFEQVALPTIRAIVAKTSDPTSSLKRFDRHIRLEHAKAQGAAKTNGSAPYRPPTAPILDHEGEEPRVRDLRADLLDRIGPAAYCRYLNDARLEPVRDGPAGRLPLKIIEARSFDRILDSDCQNVVRSVASRHGFTELW